MSLDARPQAHIYFIRARQYQDRRRWTEWHIANGLSTLCGKHLGYVNLSDVQARQVIHRGELCRQCEIVAMDIRSLLNQAEGRLAPVEST